MMVSRFEGTEINERVDSIMRALGYTYDKEKDKYIR